MFFSIHFLAQVCKKYQEIGERLLKIYLLESCKIFKKELPEFVFYQSTNRASVRLIRLLKSRREDQSYNNHFFK